MLTKDEILFYLELLNKKLKDSNLTGEVLIYRGTVMCLAYNTRNITYDIDAVFQPKKAIESYIKEIAVDYNLQEDWLNSSVAGVKSKLENEIDFDEYTKFSNLTIYVANPAYMLALKCKAARIDYSYDLNDARYLVKVLGIKSKKEAEDIFLKYFPKEELDFKVEYFLKILFE